MWQTVGQFMECQLTEATADLSRVEAGLVAQRLNYPELDAALQDCRSNNTSLTFQLNQTRVESQISECEIQRLRSIAPCTSTSGSPQAA